MDKPRMMRLYEQGSSHRLKAVGGAQTMLEAFFMKHVL